MSKIEIYLHQDRPIDPHAVRTLYARVGWWPSRTEEQIAAVLNTNIAVGAWDGDHLVGFARVISDHSFHAYIEDVMIDPIYQHKGIGKLLLTQLLGAFSHIDTLTLFCHEDLVSFYETQGFQAFPSQKIMHRRGEGFA